MGGLGLEVFIWIWFLLYIILIFFTFWGFGALVEEDALDGMERDVYKKRK